MSRILIVEDEQHLAEGLRFNLAADGHDVRVVGDGAVALALLRAERDQFDAVVLDVMLPGKNGFDVARVLRAESEGEGKGATFTLELPKLVPGRPA